jgi:AraC family transcriptional regulator
MAVDPQLIRDRNAGGEFPFVARGVFLSFQLSPALDLELRAADSLWSGRSFRGDIKVMLPGEARTFRHKKAASFAHVTIPQPLLESLDGSLRRLRPHVIVSDLPLRHLMEAWLGESEGGGPTSQLFAEGMVQALLARLAALNGQREPVLRRRMPGQLFKRALELIDARLEDDLSVAALAQACGLSASHFTALFKASAGEPPHRYQTRRRVERARELLIAGESPAAAALAVGFCDQSHLGRHMRRVTGHSPGYWERISADRSPRQRKIL